VYCATDLSLRALAQAPATSTSAKAVLGLVGAGGLGLKLQASFNTLAWPFQPHSGCPCLFGGAVIAAISESEVDAAELRQKFAGHRAT
jgi:ABC-type phosphate/phosphonate transport system permease subunit